MEEKWWSLPWISWPIGWMLGVFSGVVANWIWKKLRQKELQDKEYFSVTSSSRMLRFEGQSKINTPLYEVVKSVLNTGRFVMIDLGIYQTTSGKEYDCHFRPDEKIAHAVGPLPEPGQVGSRGVAFEVRAESEQEAKQKLTEKIGPGIWR